MNGSRERNGVKRPDRIAGKSGHCAALRSRLPLLSVNLLDLQSVDKFTIFTDFTVISLRFIPAFIGGDE